ncbi:MAG: NTP transferase domain-containing protein [Chloroflexota bacterium]
MTSANGPGPVAIILAAGLGTRMRSRLPKVLHPVCGVPMLGYVIDAALAATGRPPIVVISPATAAVGQAFEGRATFALQAEPRGTADAVRAALPELPPGTEEVVVLSGDVPLLAADLVTALLEVRRDAAAAVALVSVDSIDPTGLGRIVRDEEAGSRASSRSATPARTSSSSPRSTLASMRSMRPGCVAICRWSSRRQRQASCT